MKNVIIMVLLLLLMAVCGIGIGYIYCNYGPNNEEKTEEGEAIVEEVDGSFTNSAEAAMFQRNMVIKNQYDSVFCSMPESTVEQIAYVLISKYKSCTQEEIVDEYVGNQETYDALYKQRTEKLQQELSMKPESEGPPDEKSHDSTAHAKIQE